MAKSKCSRSYHKLPADELDVFTEQIRQGMSENPTVFVTPPVTDAAFHTLIDTYISKRAAYKTGGSAQKPAFEAAKTAIMNALDTTAGYVDDIADGDINIITLARYVATKTTPTEGHIPVQPTGIKIKRGISGEFFAECAVIAGADAYGCIMTGGSPLPEQVTLTINGQLVFEPDNQPGPGPQLAGLIADLNHDRKKHFTALPPGITFYFYFYASNATGVSPLSEVVSIVCY